ncbi:TonB-dependent receptor plug domain-containing protein [Oleiharenicola lentus]|nr:TonB-dependent receptor plug domain-containing protein [Oleiharenicola lentus]
MIPSSWRSLRPTLRQTGLACLFVSLFSPRLAAQQARATSEPADPEVIELSPFQVGAEDDTGYRANNTLAGTRLKTGLNDVAASISVITREFLNDASATDLTSLLVYTTSTEASGIGGNFTGANTSEDANLARTERSDARPQFNTRVRGLSAADLTRDYFITDVPLDSYNVDRVDINRGPNAALFGLGSPGGVINSGLKHATFRNATSVETKVDQFGSLRNVVDHNQVILKDRVALRLVGLKDDRNYEQTVAMNRNERLYADLVIKPFANTKITINGEWGAEKNRLPKLLPPIDRISPWFTYGKPGFDASITSSALNGLSAFVAANGNNQNIVGTFGDGTTFTILYNQPNNSTASVNGSIDGIVPQWNKNFDPDTNTAAFNNWRLLTINTTAQVIRGNPAAFGLNAGQASFYQAMRIMDPSVFNFYEDNVEGPNYGGFKNFRVINAAVEQTFFNNQVGFEAAFSRQVYNDGFTTHSSQWNTDALSVDINTHLPNGAVNPNFGRIYTGGNGYAESYYRERDAFRLTGFAEFDFKKRFDDNWLAKLGRHVLTGLYSTADRENHNKTYMNLRASNDLAVRKPGSYANAAAVARATERAAWVTYLSPSIAGANGIAGLNIPGITAVQNPQSTDNALLWNPITNTFDTGQKQGLYNFNNATQRDDVWTWGNNGTKESVDSIAFVLQSFLLSNKLVSTVSWRSDSVTQFVGSAPMNPATNLVQLPGQPTYSATPIIDTKSSNWSYGLVGHAPDFVNKQLPWGMQLSAHYNSSENFNAAAAGRNLYAKALPFPSGKTEEWGFSLYNDKFSLRFAHFETDQLAATINFPGQTTLWQEMANIYQWNTPAEIAASGFQVPAEIIESVNFRKTGVIYANGNPEYIQTNPVQANIKETQDYTSKGFEIEATYSPTKQWRIAANLARVNSITSNTAPYLSEFVERVMIPMWNDPKIGKALYSADRGALNNPDNLFGARSTGLLNQIRSAQARDGTPVTDARRYRFNLLTNYDFAREGRLAGFSVGAGVRYQSKISIGNALRELAAGSGTYGPDPSKPYYGPAETNFDAWAGYQRKLDFIKADWSIKFRIRNIGVGDELIPSRANPDGTIYEARIAESQVWEIVNNLRF